MKIFNFNLIYTKFYADFRSGLRFGCYQRTFWRYLICLAFEATWASSVAFFLDRTSKVTTPQDRHIFQPELKLGHRADRAVQAHRGGGRSDVMRTTKVFPRLLPDLTGPTL